MSRLSSERARTALHILILINVLVYYHARRENPRPFLDQRRTYRIIDGDLRSMLLSIFYHSDPAHLLVNVLALHRYGTELFVYPPPSSGRIIWRSAFVVALSYALCGMGAFGGLELLSRHHEYRWRRKLNDGRYASRCDGHWLCDSINAALGGRRDVTSYLTNALSDLATSIRYADVRVNMRRFRTVYRIGASGVVYGWMGMRLITSWLSPHHSRLSALDYFFVIATIAHDMRESALSFEDLRNVPSLEGDGIDHAAHVMGFVSGMIWASSLILWEKLPSFASVRWRWWGRSGGIGGGGRRLGSRCDNERLIQEQQQQRRQNSRLLNSERGNQRQRRERTSL
jgi:membrane associated rhomboid family serine protease